MFCLLRVPALLARISYNGAEYEHTALRKMKELATVKGIADIDRRNVLHPFSVLSEHEREGPRRVIVAGDGVRVRDELGRSYIDAMAGLWCTNVGYGREEIADAMREQATRLHYYHGFSSMATDAPAVLAERILSVAPARMSKVFFGTSGSDANDTQVKLVRLYNNLLGRPQKRKIIARDRGYHGVSMAAASLTGLPSLHATSACRCRVPAHQGALSPVGVG